MYTFFKELGDDGVCICQNPKVFIDFTNTCCKEGQINFQNGCADVCDPQERYVASLTGQCECAENFKKIPGKELIYLRARLLFQTQNNFLQKKLKGEMIIDCFEKKLKHFQK